MTQQLVFCEQCGDRIPASARHCRACGAQQEMLTIDPGAGGATERVAPAAPPVVHAAAGVGHRGTPPVAPGGDPRPALDPRLLRLAERARRFGDEALAPRAAAVFPGRSLSDVALPTIAGGVVAFVAACAGAWMILMLLAGEEDLPLVELPLFDLARFAVPLALGAPLVMGADVGDTGAEAELQIPLTGLVLVPLAATALGGYLSAHWFGPRTEGESWRIGTLIGASFALVLVLLSVSFAADVPVPTLPFFDEDLSSAELTLRAGAVETAVYGCLWGALGGALGGGLYGRRRFGAEGLRSRIARTRASSRHMAAVEGAVRAFGAAMVGLAVLAVLAFVLALLSESDVRALAEEPLLLLTGLFLLVPTAALASLYFSQGVGYQARGVAWDLAADEGSAGTVHLWDNPETLLYLVGTAVVVYALVRGGRRAAHAVGGADVRTLVRSGATIAIPWILLLLLVRQLASAKVSASAFGFLGESSSVAPSFGGTIFFAGALAALAGAAGGWLAWGEGRSREAAMIARAFGRIDGPSGPNDGRPGPQHHATPAVRDVAGPYPSPPHAAAQKARPRPAPPSPAPGQATMVESAPARGGRQRWSFCDRCDHPVLPTDRFCEACGHSIAAR